MGHLRDTGETYLEHGRFAWGMAIRLLLAAMALFVHGIFPSLFTHTGSDLIDAANRMLQERRKNTHQDT